MYDIVYSILAHEAPDVLENQIENIKKWNVSKNILICLHLNDHMYSLIKSNDKTTIINSNHFNKRLFTPDILNGHIKNVLFLREMNIKYKSLMLLASNVMFIKQFDINDHLPTIQISESLFEVEDSLTVAINKNTGWGGWRPFMNYPKLIEFCNEKKIPLVFDQMEGRLYSQELIEKIADLIEENKILSMAPGELIAEEIFLPSLEKYFCNDKNVEKYCKVYWGNPNLEVTIEDIHDVRNNNDKNIYCVKRIHRDLNHPVRVYINNLQV
jgi:hypothetical protein